MIRYLDLADFLLRAQAATGIQAETLYMQANLPLAESALGAPRASFGEVEFYPDFAQKVAVLGHLPGDPELRSSDPVRPDLKRPTHVPGPFPLTRMGRAQEANGDWCPPGLQNRWKVARPSAGSIPVRLRLVQRLQGNQTLEHARAHAITRLHLEPGRYHVD